MARLRDVPIAIRKEGLFQYLRHIYEQITEDNVLVWASALAYSWLLAIFPFIIFLLTLLPYIPGEQKQKVLDGINQFLSQLPAESADQLRGYVEGTIDRVLNETQTGIMSIGIILTLWTASGGVAATMSALDRCYDLDAGRPIYIQRPLAMLLTFAAVPIAIVVIILLPVGGVVLDLVWSYSEKIFGYRLPTSWKIALDVGRWVTGLFLMMVALNLLYHFGCRVKRKYRFLTPGAVFCILSWVAMGLGFRLYVDRIAHAGYNKTYGTVGGIIILMFLFYLAATILLIGAEINSETDYAAYGIPRGTRDFRPYEKAAKEAAKR